MDYTGKHILPHSLLPGPTTGVRFQCLLVPFKHISLCLEHTHIHGVSLVAQTVKNLSAMWETWVRPRGWEDPLEEGMAAHSSVLAWRISTDRGAWRVTVRGVTKGQTQPSDSAEHGMAHGHRAGPTMSISYSLPLSTAINSMSWSSPIWSVQPGPLVLFRGQCVLHGITGMPHHSATIQRPLIISGHKEVLHNCLLPPSFYTQLSKCGCVDYTF